MKEFDLAEVESKRTRDSCWVVLHSNVVDVTGYLSSHPGGGDVILERGGKDVTAEFEDVGHSNDARDVARSKIIGVIKGKSPKDCEIPKGHEHKPDGVSAAHAQDKLKFLPSGGLRTAVLVAGVACSIGCVWWFVTHYTTAKSGVVPRAK